MKKPVFAYIKATPGYFNHGVEASCPQQYFPEYADCPSIPLNEVALLPKGQPVILGGGGILTYPGLILQIAKSRPTIIWGAGLNHRIGDVLTDSIKTALDECLLVGIRDRVFAKQNDFEWVPCASVAHPLFQKLAMTVATHEEIVYAHAWNACDIFGADCYLNNMRRDKTTPEIIEELCSHRTIITNSYHGAYWGCLANRRVFLWRAKDLRFFSGFPYPLTIVHSEQELDAARQFSPRQPAIFGECIRRTEGFRYQVRELLKTL